MTLLGKLDKKRIRLDSSQALRVITRGDLLVLLAVIIVLAALFNWLFFATIRTSFTETGVLTAAGNASPVHQPDRGIVTELLVKRNDYVKAGDAVVRICPADKAEEGMTLQEMRDASVDVFTEVSGFVSETEVSVWDEVDVSTTLLYILESEQKEVSHVVALIPVSSLEMVTKGTEVKIRVNGIDAADYGILEGNVTGISEVPWRWNEMLARTGSSEAADLLCKDGVEQFHVEILLKMGENGRPAFSSGRTPRGIVCGRLCEVTFYSEEMHPYETLLSTGR